MSRELNSSPLSIHIFRLARVLLILVCLLSSVVILHAAEDSPPASPRNIMSICTARLSRLGSLAWTWAEKTFGALNPSDDVTRMLEFPTAKERLTQLYRAIHKNKPGKFMGKDHRLILKWIESSEIIVEYLAESSIREFIAKQKNVKGDTDLVAFSRYIVAELTARTIDLSSGQRSLTRARMQTVRRYARTTSGKFVGFLLGALAVVAADYVRGPLAPFNDKWMGPWYSFWYRTWNGASDISAQVQAKSAHVKRSIQELAKDASLIPPADFEKRFHQLIGEWSQIYSSFKASFGGATATGQAMDNDHRTLFYPLLDMAKSLEIQIRNIEISLARTNVEPGEKRMLEELKIRWQKDLASLLVQLELDKVVYAFNMGHTTDLDDFINKFGFEDWVKMAGGRDSLVKMLQDHINKRAP